MIRTIVKTISIFLLVINFQFANGGSSIFHDQKIEKPIKDIKNRSGVFVGSVIAEWLDDVDNDRKMRLLKDFSFIDFDSIIWFVPQNSVIDGASIPSLFWPLVGSPYVGNYRKASVVHDYYCQVKTAPFKKVHRMFFDASIANGVNKTKAKLMYAAILAGGPRWEVTEIRGENRTIISTFKPVFDESQFNEIKKWIKDSNPSVDELEEKVNGSIEKYELM